MKKHCLILLFIIPLLGLMGCVKQKNCDCGLTGKFVYYENSEKIIYCGRKVMANALFIPDNSLGYCYINGNVPIKFKSKDTLYVTVCLKEEHPNFCLAFGVSAIFKLKCIEKED